MLNQLWRRMKDWRNARKLRWLMRRLGLERHLETWKLAHVPIQLVESKHSILMQLDGDDLQVDGISGLWFQPGQVPKQLPYAFARRNGRLTGIRWSLKPAAGSEWFCVGIRLRLGDVTLAVLRDRVAAIVEELEHCRLALKNLERRFGRRESVWRA